MKHECNGRNSTVICVWTTEGENLKLGDVNLFTSKCSEKLRPLDSMPKKETSYSL